MRAYPRDFNDASKPYVPTPLIVPTGFVLLQDTREQRPLFTRLPKGLVVCSATLYDGDYSVKGFENKIAFERKGISDLFPYCSKEQITRTRSKMIRFKKMDFVGLVIEAKESDVFQFQTFTKVPPQVVAGAIISFQVRYGVHVFFGNREQCGNWILRRAVKYFNIQKEI